ncbi:hypothetical protein [Mesorhizobium sp. L-8-10]|uniref:hypothetical protein n=1 Tax=Mesorhizobium sp. L-8-10 TaxID=2744523 RepID=UPI001927BE12|nr:hypothetical protein [Mesorhizobium sp. L-8-10]
MSKPRNVACPSAHASREFFVGVEDENEASARRLRSVGFRCAAETDEDGFRRVAWPQQGRHAAGCWMPPHG